MSDALAWLDARLEGAPERLRVRMLQAVAAVPAESPVHEHLAHAAETCLARGMRDSSRESALDLLTADALFTHACQAAAEAGSDVLTEFATTWDATRFDSLLPKSI